MRALLRSWPAWSIVLAFGLAGGATRLIFGRDGSTAATVLGVALLLALAAVLIVRGGDDGWGIYGVMVFANVAAGVVHWPVGLEILAYVCVTTIVTWAAFDRDDADRERRRPERFRPL